jgi:3-oxoacyl-[acyl-carrier-protein] synthase-3
VKLGADGTQGDMLTIPAGGSRKPASHDSVSAREHFIRMRGNELFKYAVRAMEQVSRAALEEAGRPASDLALLLPHQANQRIIDATADRLGLPAEKVMMNIERYGNTSAASVPILLDEVVRDGKVKVGDLIELVAFGGGVTWGAAVVEWNPLGLPAAEVRATHASAKTGASA